MFIIICGDTCDGCGVRIPHKTEDGERLCMACVNDNDDGRD